MQRLRITVLVKAENRGHGLTPIVEMRVDVHRRIVSMPWHHLFTTGKACFPETPSNCTLMKFLPMQTFPPCILREQADRSICQGRHRTASFLQGKQQQTGTTRGY